MKVTFDPLWHDDPEWEACYKRNGRPIGIMVTEDLLDCDDQPVGFIEKVKEDGYVMGLWEIYLDHPGVEFPDDFSWQWDSPGGAKKEVRRAIRFSAELAKKEMELAKRKAARLQLELAI